MTETEQRERAARKLAEYRLQFSDYGDNAMRLAQHAALPVALTPELLHLIRINFFLDPSEESNGNWQPLPYWVEFDFLVSSLCEKVDEGLYEIEPAVRNCLLRELVRTYKNTDRVNEIATLLWQYTVHHSGRENRVGLERAQQLTALTFLAPNQASEWLAHAEAEAAKGKGVEREWYVIMRHGIEKQQRIILEVSTSKEARLPGLDSADNEEVLRQISRNNELAESQVSQGKFEEAITHYQETLKLQKQLLGDSHPEVVITLNNLANLYRNQERYGESELLYQQALAIRQSLLGEEHLYVADSLSDLAHLYRDQERYSEAEPLYQQALVIRRRVWGEEHLDVTDSLSDLAHLYRDQGRLSEAEPLYQQALAIRQQLYGDESPDIATSLNDLAVLYHDQKRYSEAEHLYQQALEIRRRILGDESPNVAESLNRLATLYRDEERYSEAETLYKEALAIRQRLLGDEHPHIAKSLSNLATLYLAQRRYEEAESLYQEALAMRRRLLGEENRYTAKSLSNLAALYFAQRRYEEAETLCQEALNIRRKLLGVNHPEVVENAKLLEEIYQRQGINTYETGSWTQEDLAVYEEENARKSNSASVQSEPYSSRPTVKDFFISYNSADKAWAEWIAWILEERGYTVKIQAWDFLPGNNFVLEMDDAAAGCTRTIAVLSDDYLQAKYTHPEWAAAFKQDPQSQESRLIPIRVGECKPEGLLGQINYIDIVGKAEVDAERSIVEGIAAALKKRGKPDTRPLYPRLDLAHPSPTGYAQSKPRFPGRRKTQNPFLPLTGAVDEAAQFFNSDRTLDRIFEVLNSGSNVALIGDRNLGKSSLLREVARQAQRRLTPPRQPIFINLVMLFSEDEFYEELCAKVGIAEDTRGNKLNRALHDQRLLLILDEVERIVQDEFSRRVRDQLRGLSEGKDAPLRLVLAARHSLDQVFSDNYDGMISPLEGICVEEAIQPWSAESVRKFITTRLSTTPVRFSEHEIADLIATSGGRPKDLMQLCNKLFRDKVS